MWAMKAYRHGLKPKVLGWEVLVYGTMHGYGRGELWWVTQCVIGHDVRSGCVEDHGFWVIRARICDSNNVKLCGRRERMHKIFGREEQMRNGNEFHGRCA